MTEPAKQPRDRAAPGYAEAWNNLGLAYEELGQSEQAVACYREAQRIRGKPIEPIPMSRIRKKDLPSGARSVDSHGGP